MLWAAYELVAAWGVHFLVQGDICTEIYWESRCYGFTDMG